MIRSSFFTYLSLFHTHPSSLIIHSCPLSYSCLLSPYLLIIHYSIFISPHSLFTHPSFSHSSFFTHPSLFHTHLSSLIATSTTHPPQKKKSIKSTTVYHYLISSPSHSFSLLSCLLFQKVLLLYYNFLSFTKPFLIFSPSPTPHYLHFLSLTTPHFFLPRNVIPHPHSLSFTKPHHFPHSFSLTKSFLSLIPLPHKTSPHSFSLTVIPHPHFLSLTKPHLITLILSPSQSHSSPSFPLPHAETSH